MTILLCNSVHNLDFLNSNFSQSSAGQNYLLATALLVIFFSAGQKCSAGQELFCSQAADKMSVGSSIKVKAPKHRIVVVPEIQLESFLLWTFQISTQGL